MKSMIVIVLFCLLAANARAVIRLYPSQKQTDQKLRDLAKSYPNILQVKSIGQSVQGREILVVKISDNVQVDEVEPEVSYIAATHGDEIVGRELLVNLLEELVTRYQTDSSIQELINNTEIFLMPCMNPDGCENKWRTNANGHDLNRQFPDFTTTDNQNTSKGREPEVQAVMKWKNSRQLALGLNYHGGEPPTANYPWDTTGDTFPLINFAKYLATEYAQKNPVMRSSRAFPGGVAHGHSWYTVDGDYQDWSYYYHHDLQVTIEVSLLEWPNYWEIPKFYLDNRESMLHFLQLVHQGAGFKLPGNQNGKVSISRDGKIITNTWFKSSEFYMVLPAGEYHFSVNSGSKLYHFSKSIKPDQWKNIKQDKYVILD